MSQMRRSQGRRSSNILPIRPLPGTSTKTSTASSSSLSSTMSTSSISSAQKRSSSIPRPSFSASVVKPNYGHNQSVAIGTTPSKAGGMARYAATTPQMGGSTPQSRGNLINMSNTMTGKPFVKETRNLNDKTCIMEMQKNVAGFLSDMGYPEHVTQKEIQKIEKQSFIKYFNFIYQFIDPNYQLAPRFNEDDVIKNLKDLGYCGTLVKSALQSIGALHSTSQIAGLLSWLVDLVRMLIAPQGEDETSEKIELKIMMDAYYAWCREQPVDLMGELREFYKQKHDVEDGEVEKIELKIQKIVEEYTILERKNSQLDELKEEFKTGEHKLDEITSMELHLQQRVKELRNEERHLIQRLNEIKEKTAAGQNEVAELLAAAKNCKVSADEARRIKSTIAANKRDHAATSEQRAQVAKLVEKREMQLANISAEEVKFDRELNVDLMDMGMTAGHQELDRKVALKNFLDSKTSKLSETESLCIAMTERKERLLAEISQLKMELKHSEHQKNRLEEKYQSVKADRDEMELLYLAQLAELESLSSTPHSDPLQMRKQYEKETLQHKFAEQKTQMEKQEKELQATLAQYAKELRDCEARVERRKKEAIDYYKRLAVGYKQVLELAEKGLVSDEVMANLLPEPDFD